MSKLNSSFCDSVNLDHIIETTITDTLKTTPEFINQNERVIMAQLLSYTKAILGKDGNADDDEISFLMENTSGNFWTLSLISAINISKAECRLAHIYYWNFYCQIKK